MRAGLRERVEMTSTRWSLLGSSVRAFRRSFQGDSVGVLRPDNGMIDPTEGATVRPFSHLRPVSSTPDSSLHPTSRTVTTIAASTPVTRSGVSMEDRLTKTTEDLHGVQSAVRAPGRDSRLAVHKHAAGGGVDTQCSVDLVHHLGRTLPDADATRRVDPPRHPGSRTRSSPSKSPARAAARKASTTARCCWPSPVGRGVSCTFRRARQAYILAASPDAPMICPISSNGTANMSCNTNANRSAGRR